MLHHDGFDHFDAMIAERAGLEKVMKAQRCVTALRTAESGSGGVCAGF